MDGVRVNVGGPGICGGDSGGTARGVHGLLRAAKDTVYMTGSYQKTLDDSRILGKAAGTDQASFLRDYLKDLWTAFSVVVRICGCAAVASAAALTAVLLARAGYGTDPWAYVTVCEHACMHAHKRMHTHA